ncbi:MAG: hypothetical protein HC796_07730 [Synechococcaceae cyanobacterium RL_1_2]|nr:hypothetical protein [Synechococcaceae cyanobacterium RL_1_2]
MTIYYFLQNFSLISSISKQLVTKVHSLDFRRGKSPGGGGMRVEELELKAISLILQSLRY